MKTSKNKASKNAQANEIISKNETSTKKVKKVKKSKDSSTVKKIKTQVDHNLVQEVVTQREVKYIYPEDCQDTLSRKKYRQAVRNQLHKLELEMHRIEDKNSKAFKAKKKEYEEFKAANLKQGAAA